MRLIDADKLLKEILTAGIGKTIIEYSESDIGYMIRRQPTVDAAELLRDRWISVKDRLPEEDGKYLVFEQNNGRTNTSILRFAKDARKVDRYDFKSRWENAWYEYDSEWGHYTVDSVTHWMPIPEPPEE